MMQKSQAEFRFLYQKLGVFRLSAIRTVLKTMKRFGK